MSAERAAWPAMPPFKRSRKATALTTAAAEGRFQLQKCTACGHVSYPPREACPHCWCMDIRWTDLPPGGVLLAESTLRISFNAWFQERLPWRVGTVKLDAGPVILAHIHGDVPPRARVHMIARTDVSGQGVLLALPEQETPHMLDDRQSRDLARKPDTRRVLITDGVSETGQCMARAFAAAGASVIYLGIAGEPRSFPGREALESLPGVVFVPLDVRDAGSADALAGRIGDAVDILVNTARHPGSNGEGDGASTGHLDDSIAREEMEINYIGLLRLMQAFAPGMRSRAAGDGNVAGAWVNLFSVYALANVPALGTAAASEAAAYSLSQCLRAKMVGSGVKVVNVLFGPLHNASNRRVRPPKVTQEQLAGGVVDALRQGLEDLALGSVAKDVMRRYREDPLALHREILQEELTQQEIAHRETASRESAARNSNSIQQD